MTELLDEPQSLEPVDDWSQVDPDYEYIPAGDDGQDDAVEDPEELDEDLTEEEIEVPDDLSELLPFWVSYELHGRNLDAETTWERLAVEDFDGELEVEVDGLTAGARWEFRVRLIDRDGRHSRFSDALVIDLPTDFTPPPAPTEPIVRNVRGYTAVGWDGLLQGPIPADMSHVQLYVQQQHPEGDPDGEPGDPRRITTMASAGEHPLLQFLANVLHKAWFTAVDTTGNESPWSPQVEFTPEPPVDTDAIEAELDDARDRLDQAEQDLAEGMSERVAEIEHLQNNVIPDLEAALNTGLSDEVTRLEGMITTAGGTVILRDTRDPIEDDADNLPQGTIFYRYDTLDAGGELEGMWTWDGTSWAEFTLSESIQAQMHIETGTYGTMSGDRLTAHTVETNHLLVGPNNIITDQDFDTLGNGDARSWYVTSGDWYTISLSWMSRPFARISNASASEGVHQLRYGSHPDRLASIPCVPGETYKLRFQVVRYSGWSSDDDYRAQFRWVDANGEGISWDTSNFASVANQGWHTLEGTAPDDATHFYIRFYKAGTAGAARGVGNVSLEKMTDTSLIVRGAVKSHSVDTEEFFAAQAVIEKVWTDIVRSRLIESEGIITEDMIATGAITTPKLTVTEEMVGEVARLLRIEAGSLASNDIEAMRIVSSLIEATTYLIHDANGDVSVRLDGVDNYFAGELRLPGVDSGQVAFRSFHAEEIFDNFGGSPEYSGLGFESTEGHRTSGLFIRESDARVTLTSGTGGDSTEGRSMAWMAGGWSVQWLRPDGRLETHSNALVGREVEVTLHNDFRPSGITGVPRYVRLGDWVMLSGAVRPPTTGNWSGDIMSVPPPSRLVRIGTSITPGPSNPDAPSIMIDIDENGFLSIRNGQNVTAPSGRALSLDGFVYKL